jgi:hypothetical protein
MSQGNYSNYSHACEFTIPIKLNIPIEINPVLNIGTVASVQQNLPVFLHPELYLEPQVLAEPAKCEYYPEQTYKQEELPEAYKQLPVKETLHLS